MKIECPDCKEKVGNMLGHVCRSGPSKLGKISDGSGKKSQVRMEQSWEPLKTPIPAVVASGPSGASSPRPFKRPLASEREQTVSYQKPWEALGMSRRTWYRREKKKREQKA